MCIRDSSNSPGIIAGFDAFRPVGNAVVCKYFMEGPAVGGAGDPVGDGIPNEHDVSPVSYTHLEVYKRQAQKRPRLSRRGQDKKC